MTQRNFGICKRKFLPVVSSGSWLKQVAIWTLFVFLLKPSHPQPEPWTATVAAVNSFLKFSRLPNAPLISLCNSLDKFVFFGVRFFQKIEWFMWPPPLNFKAPCNAIILDVSFFCNASCNCTSAALKFVMYAWWCFWWCTSMIWPEIIGSSALKSKSKSGNVCFCADGSKPALKTLRLIFQKNANRSINSKESYILWF